jgi:hypothetical protein
VDPYNQFNFQQTTQKLFISWCFKIKMLTASKRTIFVLRKFKSGCKVKIERKNKLSAVAFYQI